MDNKNTLTICILITTIDNGIQRVINELLPQLDCVDEVIISHQITDKRILPEKMLFGDKITYVYMYNSGVSKNRNNALSYLKSDIGVFCDDDVNYIKGFETIIKDKFHGNKDIDLLTFEFLNEKNIKLKKYTTEGKHNILSVLNLGGLEISFRKKSLLEKKILFDLDFGFSKYVSGEDSIFLTDCIKNNLICYHVNSNIGIHPDSRSWSIWSERSINDKGAVFFRIFGYLSFVIIIYFSIIKYKEYNKNIGFLNFIYLIFNGNIKYLLKK